MVKNEILILSILTVSILCILIILLSYLIVRKLIENKKRKKIESYEAQISPIIFFMISEASVTTKLPNETPLQLQAIENILGKFSKVLEGKNEKKYLSELATMYLKHEYQRRLKSMRWSTRLNTLYQIEDFNMEDLMYEVYLLLIKKKRISHDEIKLSLRILAQFRYSEILRLLMNQFVHLSEYDFRSILIRLDQEKFDQLILHFHKCLPPLQKAILDVISIKKGWFYLSFVENIFASSAEEIKVRALKAIAEIGYVNQIEPFIELLYSKKWEERMFATKIMGVLKEESTIPRLIELLHDPSWWVRSQAGQAIYQFTNGKEILKLVLATSQDVFAKDMAWEWLNKGV
ncbi:MAG: HEAT repeat domain-containing protein [Bacillota bacterium]|nr:HEAT repeat domain-containing protein [Bacillota bacterium]